MPFVIPAVASIVSFIGGGAGAAVAGAAVTSGAVAAGGAGAAMISAAVTSAMIGAAVGAATSAIKGENVINGALMGAGVGAVGGALVSGLGAAANAVSTGTEVAGTSATTGLESATAAANPVAESQAAQQAAISGMGGGGSTAPTIGPTVQAAEALSKAGGVGTPPPSTSLFDGAFMGKHGGEVVGRGVAGLGEGLLKSRSSEAEIEALMERDRLNIDSKKVKGLSNIKTPMLPTISAFTQKPKWQDLFQS